MRRAIILARQYLREFQLAFPNCERVLAVRQLHRQFRRALQSEEWQGVERLRAMPTPNYALMHHQTYRLVWGRYQRMMAQVQMAEQAWKHRHRLIMESLLMWLHSMLQLEASTSFRSQLWLDAEMQEGGFFSRTSFFQVYVLGQTVLELTFIRARAQLEIQLPCACYHVELYYLPEGASPVMLPPMPAQHEGLMIHEAESSPLLGEAENMQAFRAGSDVGMRMAQYLMKRINQWIQVLA